MKYSLGIFCCNWFINTLNMKIGYALSGGGLRGVAHIAVLKAFEENGIKPDIMSGTSAGSIVAALYGSGASPKDIYHFVSKSNLYKVISFGWPLMGFASLHYLKKRMKEYKEDLSFETLNIPIKITTTNINTGKLVVMESGDIIEAVAASCAIPMVFEPIEIEEELYVDGGVMLNLPVSIIRNDCDFLIGVNLMPKLELSTDRFGSLISIAARTFEMSIWRNQQEEIPLCDYHLEINGLHKYHLFNIYQIERIYKLGYETTIQNMDTILQKLAECKGDLNQNK
jgi:NTE family protein